MSRYVTLILMLAIWSSVFSQEKELKNVLKELEQKNYMASFEEVNKARGLILDRVVEELSSVTPKKVFRFEVVDSGIDESVEGNGVTMTRIYRLSTLDSLAASPKDNEILDDGVMDFPVVSQEGMLRIEISTNLLNASEVFMAHTMNTGSGVEAFRVKGYKAITKLYEDQAVEEGDENSVESPAREESQVVVGGALVVISSEGVKPGLTRKVLDKIDFEKLVTIVGN